MDPHRKKLCIGAGVLVIALGYLVYAGIKLGSSYYLQVDTFLADTTYHSQYVQLHGKVGRNDLEIDEGRLSVRFRLLGERGTLPTAYSGAIPDLFKPGCEVLVEGQLGSDGVFRAEKLLTKCASKYDQDPRGHTRGPT